MIHRPWRTRRRQIQSLLVAALQSLVRWPVYLLVGLIPKDPGLCAFGSWTGKQFGDNAKWLFLYLTRPGRATGCRLVWISRRRSVVRAARDLGRPALWLWSPGGLVAAARARTFVFDADSRSIAFWASRSTRRINLFHGIALKQLGADIETRGHHLRQAFHGRPWRRAVLLWLAPWLSERYDLLVAASCQNADVMASAFRVDRDAVAVTGLPRNDVLHLSEEQLAAEFGIRPPPSPAPGRRIVLYGPTFRDFDRTARPIPLDWEAIEDLMRRHEASFLVKLHPLDAAHIPVLERFEHVRLLPQNADLYPLLRHVEVLITDYSSVFFDFLLLDRPIIFYPYDLEHYRRRDRDFYYTYEDVTPGPHARDSTDLVRCLERTLVDGADSYRDARHRLRQRFHVTNESACAAVARQLRTLTA